MWRIHLPTVVVALAAAAEPAVAADPASKLFVVLIIDTDAAKVGGPDRIHRAAAKADLKKWRDIIDDVVAANPDQFQNRIVLRVLEGEENVRPAKVKQTLRELPTDPTCSVLVYYTGHGATDKTKGHYFAASGGNLLRSEVRDILVQKKLKSAFLISDCCSEFVEIDRKNSERAPPLPAKWRVFQNLFFESYGLIDFTAATDGQLAWLDPDGGFFTTALTRALCLDRGKVRGDGKDAFVSWDTLFMTVRADTNAAFQSVKVKAGEGSDVSKAGAQFPQAFSLGDDREVYIEGNGSFFGSDGPNWVEVRTAGPNSDFEEKRRTPEYVELYDDSRSIYVRIFDEYAVWSVDYKDWRKWPKSEGSWQRGRSRFVAKNGYFWRVGGNVWVEKGETGHVNVFQEKGRTDGHVELYDESRDMYVQLHDDMGVWSRNKKEWFQWPGSDGRWLKVDR